ncbi:MAG: hypothetical protein R3199_02000 [Gemmatimonadota bacterium]|nr:hypothetical protein [Gemmatimonadota bacterium]
MSGEPLRAYLAGAMERAPDRGREWREGLLPLFEELGHEVFHPNVEEAKIVSPEERANFREWKANGHAEFRRMMRRIIDHDIAALERCDYLVCYWDRHAHGSGGTPSEVTLMHHWGRPVYLVLGVPRVEVSSWVLGCATRVFETFDDLAEHLRGEHGP